MAQEFFIKSENLESQVRKLLPSQGGFGAGFDLSASSQIIPVIDLTESAEGSNLRSDLQTAFSFASATSFDVNNTSTTVISNTGFYRVIATFRMTGTGTGKIQLTDGATTKDIVSLAGSTTATGIETIDKIFFLKAGDSLLIESSSTATTIRGSFRQIADIDGNLVDPA